jgi:hypothetical protein
MTEPGPAMRHDQRRRVLMPRLIAEATDWLEDLADAGNIDDHATGLGNWPDAITPPTDPPPGTDLYVSHVAAPSYRRRSDDPDARRFIHRSLREHLLAKALIRNDPTGVTTLVQRHLWFDPDWVTCLRAGFAAPLDTRHG